MMDIKSYRIIIASIGTLIVILGMGMVACGLTGKPIPTEFTNLLSISIGGLLGLCAPSPTQQTPERRDRLYASPDESTMGPDDRFKRRP